MVKPQVRIRSKLLTKKLSLLVDVPWNERMERCGLPGGTLIMQLEESSTEKSFPPRSRFWCWINTALKAFSLEQDPLE